MVQRPRRSKSTISCLTYHSKRSERILELGTVAFGPLEANGAGTLAGKLKDRGDRLTKNRDRQAWDRTSQKNLREWTPGPDINISSITIDSHAPAANIHTHA